MLQAITTKYFGPTTFRGSRIKATCPAKSMYYPYLSELSSEENHIRAAKLFVMELSAWEKNNDLYSGYTKDGMAHVRVPKKGE